MAVSVGDKVQIKAGGVDVTNGVKAKAGKLYGEGGPLFGEVVKIVEGWNTEGKYGLPKKVTKVRISDGKGTIVWQVRPEDVAENKIVQEEPEPEPEPPKHEPEPEPEPEPTEPVVPKEYAAADVSNSSGPYALQYGWNRWDVGYSSREGNTAIGGVETVGVSTNQTSETDAGISTGKTTESTKPVPFSEVGAFNIEKEDSVVTKPRSIINDSGFRQEILNERVDLIQNSYSFPAKAQDSRDLIAARYDYSFIPGDPRYSGPASSMEDKLMEFRTAMGIPVHGSQNLARSMKFYMYNRYKVPDTNMAQKPLLTHIFFTRPDLYLLDDQNTACPQVLNHTETALMWRRFPELFKLLTDRVRCSDENNFNMLLSNQVMSFSLHDEKIATKEAGASWTKQVMMYGDSYTGRGADTFECTFMETNELSIINLMKLWLTYIDNVHTGAWSPNYNSGCCHVHDRALDYAASVYVFKVDPNGEDILYWSKYYGVFPMTTGASALSWENNEHEKILLPNVEFQYSFKRDLSPISLLEFNDVGRIEGSPTYVPSYNPDVNHVVRPYVGTPYIELDHGTPNMSANDVNYGKKMSIKLRFMSDSSPRRSDENLFR